MNITPLRSHQRDLIYMLHERSGWWKWGSTFLKMASFRRRDLTCTLQMRSCWQGQGLAAWRRPIPFSEVLKCLVFWEYVSSHPHMGPGLCGYAVAPDRPWSSARYTVSQRPPPSPAQQILGVPGVRPTVTLYFNVGLTVSATVLGLCCTLIPKLGGSV